MHGRVSASIGVSVVLLLVLVVVVRPSLCLPSSVCSACTC